MKRKTKKYLLQTGNTKTFLGNNKINDHRTVYIWKKNRNRESEMKREQQSFIVISVEAETKVKYTTIIAYASLF